MYDVVQIFTHFGVFSEGKFWCEKGAIDGSLMA